MPREDRRMKRAVVLVLVVACSSDDKADTQGTVSSCDLTADAGYCVDYAADAPAGKAQADCDAINNSGSFHAVANESASCATADRVGSCSATIGGIDVVYRYYGPTYTTADAQSNCTTLGGTNGAGGTFTPN